MDETTPACSLLLRVAKQTGGEGQDFSIQRDGNEHRTGRGLCGTKKSREKSGDADAFQHGVTFHC
jgi:hypothetical protein